jgi:hypothetical protein
VARISRRPYRTPKSFVAANPGLPLRFASGSPGANIVSSLRDVCGATGDATGWNSTRAKFVNVIGLFGSITLSLLMNPYTTVIITASLAEANEVSGCPALNFMNSMGNHLGSSNHFKISCNNKPEGSLHNWIITGVFAWCDIHGLKRVIWDAPWLQPEDVDVYICDCDELGVWSSLLDLRAEVKQGRLP